MKQKPFWLTPFFAFSLLAVPGCGSDEAESSGSCTIVDLGDGNSAIRCPDGSELVVPKGKDGEKGEQGDKGSDASCTLGEKDGQYTLTCGDQAVVVGDSCPDGFPYDVIAASGPESAALLTLFQVSNCTWVRGDVVVAESESVPTALRRIEKVDGDLIVTVTAAETISFPNLTEVGDDVYITQNPLLATVEFAALTTAGGVYFDDNALLETVRFPVLKTATALAFSYNGSLVAIDGFPALESIDRWLHFSANEKLETVSNFGSLKSVGGIELWSNNALESVADFPALEEIKGWGDGPGAGYALVYIEDHAALTSFGKLGSVSTIDGDVAVYRNPELPQADVDALFEDIDVTGEKFFCGNKGGDACLD